MMMSNLIVANVQFFVFNMHPKDVFLWIVSCVIRELMFSVRMRTFLSVLFLLVGSFVRTEFFNNFLLFLSTEKSLVTFNQFPKIYRESFRVTRFFFIFV